MRFYYRRGGKGAAPEGFDRVYTEVDGDGNVLRELLAYVRADDSVTVEMGGELGGTAGAFVEMDLPSIDSRQLCSASLLRLTRRQVTGRRCFPTLRC
ncbi:MAG: hypothetical protein ACLTZJ_05910 [Oscillospiraceae bacterium]